MDHAASMLLAYIDPGTGAIVLQALLAAVLGAGVVFRRFLSAPLAWFRRPEDNPTENAEDQGDADRVQKRAA